MKTPEDGNLKFTRCGANMACIESEHARVMIKNIPDNNALSLMERFKGRSAYKVSFIITVVAGLYVGFLAGLCLNFDDLNRQYWNIQEGSREIDLTMFGLTTLLIILLMGCVVFCIRSIDLVDAWEKKSRAYRDIAVYFDNTYCYEKLVSIMEAARFVDKIAGIVENSRILECEIDTSTKNRLKMAFTLADARGDVRHEEAVIKGLDGQYNIGLKGNTYEIDLADMKFRYGEG